MVTKMSKMSILDIKNTLKLNNVINCLRCGYAELTASFTGGISAHSQ